MNLDKINQWMTLAANLGVLIGIVFLALEIQQNTRVTEREILTSRQDVLHREFIGSDHLPRILAEMNSVKGHPAEVVELSEAFNLSPEDALRWTRYLAQIWAQNLADWELEGRDNNGCFGAALLSQEDNQIFWKHRKNQYDPDFIECIENIAFSIQ